MGVGEGAIFGAHWAVRDWKFPSVGSVKQGQDVKGIVMVSPKKVFKGVAMDAVVKDPMLLQLPILIVDGAEAPNAKESERLAKRIEKSKRPFTMPGGKVISLQLAPTRLTGPVLVKGVKAVGPAIAKFITANIDGAAKRNAWVKRP